MDECSKFVFTTADALQSQFQKIQITPALGKKGEILFTPIQDLVPGLVKSNATNAESMRLYAELTHSRNENCIHVAYFYVRVFQIYSALALTVINADPVRRRVGVIQGQRGPQGQQSGPQRAVLLGGAIPKTGKYGAVLRSSVIATPLLVLAQYLDPVGEASSVKQTLRISDVRTGLKGNLYIFWEYPNATTELNLEAVYKRTSGIEVPGRVSVKRDGATIVVSIDGSSGSLAQTFTQGVDQLWGFKYDGGEARNDPIPFYDEIQEIFADTDDVAASYPSTSGSASSGIPGSSAGTSSATAFEGFDKLKKLFEDTSTGAREFPKAYCIARAMTLLTPIFPNELADKGQPYYSQICKRNYDFEPGEALMPRAGTSAKSNVYLRSLVSLYYDDYKYDRTKKTIKLTQTESGRSELQGLSKEFAALYMMPTAGADSFLAADDDKGTTLTQFRELPFCAKKDALIRIDRDAKGAEFLNKLQAEVIQPMLAFQEEHTKKVNALLMKIFKVETNSKAQVSLKIVDAVKAKGTEGINMMGKEAHRLLREYYRRSEALYMKGVLLFEKNPAGWKI
jgi:hypothetical protein